MAKSVELLGNALECEEISMKKYEETLDAMAHDEAKGVIEKIIKDKKEHMASLSRIIERSSKCPAVKK